MGGYGGGEMGRRVESGTSCRETGSTLDCRSMILALRPVITGERVHEGEPLIGVEDFWTTVLYSICISQVSVSARFGSFSALLTGAAANNCQVDNEGDKSGSQAQDEYSSGVHFYLQIQRTSAQLDYLYRAVDVSASTSVIAASP